MCVEKERFRVGENFSWGIPGELEIADTETTAETTTEEAKTETEGGAGTSEIEETSSKENTSGQLNETKE